MSEFSPLQIQEIVSKGVEQAFVRMGIQADNPIEMQKDFQHLREWRTSMEAVKRKSVLSAIGVIVAGIITAIWVGVRALFNGS